MVFPLPQYSSTFWLHQRLREALFSENRYYVLLFHKLVYRSIAGSFYCRHLYRGATLSGEYCSLYSFCSFKGHASPSFYKEISLKSCLIAKPKLVLDDLIGWLSTSEFENKGKKSDFKAMFCKLLWAENWIRGILSVRGQHYQNHYIYILRNWRLIVRVGLLHSLC